MQSLEFNGPRVEIFAPHAPSFGSATRVQPLRSTPDTLPDTSTSAQIVSFELGTHPIFAQDDPPAVSFGLSAQAASSEPPASAQTTLPRLDAVPIIYLHALEFGAAGVGEIYELVSRRSGADFVLAAIYLNEAQ